MSSHVSVQLAQGVRIPEHADQRSGLMMIAIPG